MKIEFDRLQIHSLDRSQTEMSLNQRSHLLICYIINVHTGTVMMSYYNASMPTCGNWFQTKQPERMIAQVIK